MDHDNLHNADGSTNTTKAGIGNKIARLLTSPKPSKGKNSK